jgi:tetratricopeptide (TPR) repeat protein
MVYLRRAAQAGRTAGLTAFAQQDYPTALVQLGKYLSRYPNDVDILLPYAQAREHVVESNGSHLGQAISLMLRVLELRPGLIEAQRDLLDLYVAVGRNTEAIALADQILSRKSDNSAAGTADATHALQCEVTAQMRMQQLAKAQDSLNQLIKITPLDLEVRILELQIMLKQGTAEQVVAHADQLAKDYPNDNRFALLRSIAATFAGDTKSATSLVQPLVTSPQVDPAYTRLLVQQLDNVGLFDDSFSVIQRAARENSDSDTERLWVRRLFEANQFALLVDQTAGLDINASSTDVEALAMRALALSNLDRRADASAIVAALEKRGPAATAAARWAAVLHVTALHESSDPVKTIGVLRDALAASPSNPILLQELGDAYADAGSRDKAMAAWRDVMRVAPEWSAPLVQVSRTYLAAGRPADALAAAQAARLRAPHDHDALVAVAVATAANLPDGPSPDADKALAMIADIQKQFPKDQGLLPLRVGVLARSQQKDAALDCIRMALSSDVVPAEQVLLSLAQMSQTFALNQEEACWTASEKAHGLTADLALARALWLLEQKKPSDGLALLQQACASHPDSDLVWKRAWAQYLDLSGDARAKDQWIALGDANPKDVKLQWGAIAARSVQADHAFVGRTIDRLVSLLGEDGLDLQLLRARWYLSGQSGDSDATQAAILLGNITRSAPGMLAPRLLLANCYMRLGNTSGALDQLVAASDAQPDLAELSIEVARMFHAQGDFTRSRQFLDRACGSKQATVDIKRQAASLIALQGDYPAALALLEKTYANEKQQPADVVLAALYRQLGQFDKTSDICKRLLEKPDEQSVAFASDFYASQGRTDDAKSALTLLDGLKLAPGKKETILARYASRYGTSDDALKYYQAAAAAAPQQQDVWQQLVNFCFSSGKIDEALAAAAEASGKIPNAAGFDVLRQNAALIKGARDIVGLRPLLMTLSGNSTTDAPVLEAINDVVTATQKKVPPEQTVAKLRQLADRNPRLLALQIITLDLYIDSGQMDEAIRMASRTVQSFPAAVEPLRVETDLLSSARRWSEVLGAAQEWKRRDPTDPLDADLAIAGAELQLGDVSAADQLLQPYLDRATQDPDKYSGVIVLRASGLLANHQPDQVENLIGPLLAKSQRMRSAWVSLAATRLDDPQRAAAWLDRVGALTPDNPAEKVTLANAWITIGQRWSNSDYQQKGRTQLVAIAQPQDAPVEALVSLGMACEGTADWAGAQAAYRRAIAREPGNPIALNNLASVLVKSGGDLAEAQQLVNKAISLYPNTPTFLDTRAMVQAARKDYSGAIASLREAQKLDPQNFKWRVNILADMIDAGQIQSAKTEMQQIAAAFPTLSSVPLDLRQRYDSLCAKLQ